MWGKDPLEIIPRTFYLAPNAEDARGELVEFTEYNRKHAIVESNSSEKNDTPSSKGGKKDKEEGLIWIAKPASYANRRFGIKGTRGLKGALEVEGRSATNEATADRVKP